MNKLILCLLFSMAVATATSQKVYFVYLQTDNGQSFFVKMNEKVYSSAASGYLILPMLHDSSYNFSVGFPQNKSPEQKFSVVINKKDHGYLLKNFGEKGWGLFDLETLAIQMSTSAIIKPDTYVQSGKQNVSVFTDILAKAADDPSLREKPVQPVVEEKKTELAIQPVVEKETIKTEERNGSLTKTNDLNQQPIGEKVGVKKKTKGVSVAKPVAVIEQPVEKKGDVKAEEKAVTETKPATVIEQPVEKKGDAKAEEKAVTETKPAMVIEQPVEKKGDAKTEEKAVTETKPATVIEQPVEIKGDAKTGEKEATETKPVTIIEQPVEKKEEIKAETKEKASSKTEETEEIKVLPAEEYQKSMVVRKSESSTTEGFGLVFIDDFLNGIKDTIRIMIPNPKPVVIPIKEVVKEEKKFIDINTEVAQNKEQGPQMKQDVMEALAVKPVVKNSCLAFAEESDFLKLRKRMAAIESDDGMVNEAKKYFKTKCFSTVQVKNLGALFLTDSGKYHFFDAAYGSVSDIDNFSSLQAELKDDFYITRFKAMLK